LQRRGLGRNKMDEGIMIQSNSIVVREGKIMMMKNENHIFTPGGLVLEGEDPEKVCIKDLGRAKIVKVLHPRLVWKKLGNKKFPILTLNYLTEIVDV
jgi:hypothetical protein